MFKYILSNNPHQNPLLYLGNLDYKLLNSLLEFVYLGQVNIEDTSLDGFLVAGRQLRLEGLNEEVFTIRPEQTDTCPEEQKTEDPILREPPEAETDPFTREKQNNTIEEIKCEMCDNNFKTVSDFNSHMLSCRMSQNLSEIGPELIASLRSNYSCENCEYTGLSKAALNKHTFSEHNGSQCNQCQFKAATSAQLFQHTQANHSNQQFLCTECNKYYTDESALKSHNKSSHSPNNVFCNKCKGRYSSQTKLDIHNRLCTICLCDLCEYGAQSEAGLLKHKQFKHEGIRYNCDLCTYQTGFQEQLTTHKEVRHKSGKPSKSFRIANFPCGQCETRCITPAGLEMHKKAMHIGKEVALTSRFSCDMCEYTATTNGNLMIHKKRKHA